MTQVIVNKYDGSIAENIRDYQENEHESSSNFTLTKPHILEAIPDTIVDTSTGDPITDLKLTDVILDATDNAVLVALGKKSSSSSNMAFFKSDALGNAWTITAQRGAGIVLPNTLFSYKGKAHALELNGSDTKLIRYTDDSTATDRGTLTGATQSNLPKPFVHPEDGKAYMGSGYIIGTWDDTTLTTFSTMIPTDKTITSFAGYGSYLAIGVKPTTNVGNSLTYLWGRDTTLNTAQGIIDWGFGNLIALENIGEILVAVLVVQNTNTTITSKLQLKTWSGGEVQTVQEIELASGIGTAIPPYNFKAKTRNSLYFTLSADTCIYKVTKNKDGVFTLNRERFVANGSSPSTINGFSLINDIMWVGYSISGGATNTFFHNKLSATATNYTNTCTYKTMINPNMVLTDRGKDKQLTGVRLLITGIASSGTTTLKYYVDGGVVATIEAKANTSGEIYIESTNESDGKALKSGKEFQFLIESTGNAKIKEFAYFYTTTPTLTTD